MLLHTAEVLAVLVYARVVYPKSYVRNVVRQLDPLVDVESTEALPVGIILPVDISCYHVGGDTQERG